MIQNIIQENKKFWGDINDSHAWIFILDNLRFADKQTMQPIGLQTIEEDIRLIAIMFWWDYYI